MHISDELLWLIASLTAWLPGWISAPMWMPGVIAAALIVIALPGTPAWDWAGWSKRPLVPACGVLALYAVGRLPAQIHALGQSAP